MSILEVLLIAVGLAMDAFAVAICKGLSLKKIEWKKVILVGVYFGLFQGLMPLLGYFLGSTFISLIESFDHYVSFAILLLIGINMIRESFKKDECDEKEADFSFKTMVVLAIATSIDAFSVGITLAANEPKIGIVLSVLLIGVITFIISSLGVLIGHYFGKKFEKVAEIIGGCVLIVIGIKLLLSGLGVIPF